MKLQGTYRGIKPDEVIFVGKYWLWMTVFSACLFTSCGDTNQDPSESTSPEPTVQVVPARYNQEVIPSDEIEVLERNDPDPDQFEEFPDSDFDDLELERFEDDDVQPDEFEEVR